MWQGISVKEAWHDLRNEPCTLFDEPIVERLFSPPPKARKRSTILSLADQPNDSAADLEHTMKVHGSMKYFAAFALVVACCPAIAQEKVKKPVKAELAATMPKTERLEVEFKVKMLELELKLAHIATEQVRVEHRRVEQHLKALESEADPREREAAELHLQQVALEVQSHEVKMEMARLRLEQAKAYLKVHAVPMVKKHAGEGEYPVPVKIEVDDDSDVMIIRGPKASVEKMKKLLEKTIQATKK